MPASPTAARSAASRTNGARSKGPVTPEGKPRAALNGLSPGPRLAHMQFLAGEDPLLLENLRRARLRAFQPEDADELAAVEAMVRAEWHLIRLDRLLDLQVAGKSPDALLRAAIGSRWGRDGMEHLGRWREREERSLDRAHRRFLRQRRARRQGLVVAAEEPADLPPAANENKGEAAAAPVPVEKIALEPERAPVSAAREVAVEAAPPVPAGAGASEGAAALMPPVAVAGQSASGPRPTASASIGRKMPSGGEQPRPAAAKPTAPRALYAEVQRHGRPDRVAQCLEGLDRPGREALLDEIRRHGFIDREPIQVQWAWRALMQRW